jgi:streptogramin lyase
VHVRVRPGRHLPAAAAAAAARMLIGRSMLAALASQRAPRARRTSSLYSTAIVHGLDVDLVSKEASGPASGAGGQCERGR